MNRIDFSPSALLFNKLARSLVPTQADIEALKGRNVHLRDEQVKARVVDIIDSNIIYVPHIHKGKTIPKLERKEFSMRPTYVNIPQLGRATVRSSQPESISFVTDPTGYPFVKFAPNDIMLDEILKTGLSSFPEIKSFQDVKNVTQWLYDEIPYSTLAMNRFDENLSLGEFTSIFGFVCRHKMAIEFALLHLRNIESKPRHVNVEYLSSTRKNLLMIPPNSRHVYLDITIEPEGSTIKSDPTWGNCADPVTFEQNNLANGVIFRDEKTVSLRGTWGKNKLLQQ